jgi:hypothetical protein
MQVLLFLSIHTHTVHTYIHTYIHISIYNTYSIYIHTYVHTYIQYIHTHIHTYSIYIHTYIHTVHTYVLGTLRLVCDDIDSECLNLQHDSQDNRYVFTLIFLVSLGNGSGSGGIRLG